MKKAGSGLVQSTLQQTAHLQLRPEASKLLQKRKSGKKQPSAQTLDLVHLFCCQTYLHCNAGACAAFCHFVSRYQGAEGGESRRFPFCSDGLRPIT